MNSEEDRRLTSFFTQHGYQKPFSWKKIKKNQTKQQKRHFLLTSDHPYQKRQRVRQKPYSLH